MKNITLTLSFGGSVKDYKVDFEDDFAVALENELTRFFGRNREIDAAKLLEAFIAMAYDKFAQQRQTSKTFGALAEMLKNADMKKGARLGGGSAGGSAGGGSVASSSVAGSVGGSAGGESLGGTSVEDSTNEKANLNLSKNVEASVESGKDSSKDSSKDSAKNSGKDAGKKPNETGSVYKSKFYR